MSIRYDNGLHIHNFKQTKRVAQMKQKSVISAVMSEAIRYYALREQYEMLVAKVRQCAPSGVSEKWGVVKFRGVPDFRLNFGRSRVIEVAPMPRHIGVFMEWRKIFKNSGVYVDDTDFHLFEDTFGYLGVNENWNQPWNVQAGTDLSDPYVTTFLESGMRLIVKEIHRAHPTCKGSRILSVRSVRW